MRSHRRWPALQDRRTGQQHTQPVRLRQTAALESTSTTVQGFWESEIPSSMTPATEPANIQWTTVVMMRSGYFTVRDTTFLARVRTDQSTSTDRISDSSTCFMHHRRSFRMVSIPSPITSNVCLRVGTVPSCAHGNATSFAPRFKTSLPPLGAESFGRFHLTALGTAPQREQRGIIRLHRTPPTSGARPVSCATTVRASSRQLYHLEAI